MTSYPLPTTIGGKNHILNLEADLDEKMHDIFKINLTLSLTAVMVL